MVIPTSITSAKKIEKHAAAVAIHFIDAILFGLVFELLSQQAVVPGSVFSQPVIGNHEGARLGLGETGILCTP